MNISFADLIDTVDEGIILQESSGRIIIWNKFAETVFGIPAEDAVGRTSIDAEWHTIHEDGSKFEGKDHPSMITLQTGRSCRDVVMGIRPPDGDVRWISVNTRPVFSDAATAPSAVVITFWDITEKRRTEKALEESRLLFKSFAESSPDAIYITDDRMTILDWNRAASDMFGYSREEIIGQPTARLVPEEQRKKQRELVEHHKERKTVGAISPVETIGLKKDGTVFSIEAAQSGWQSEGKSFYCVVVRDITRRKQQEAALLESESRFRSIAETTSDAIITTDCDLNIIYWNKAAEHMFGYSASEALGHPPDFLMVERERELHDKEFGQFMQSGYSAFLGSTMESYARRKDGTEFPVEITLSHWESDNRIYMCAMVRDITKRKQQEIALSESERQYRSLVETVPEAIINVDGSGKIILWNRGAESIYGYSREEAIGRHILFVTPERDREKHRAHLDQAVARGIEYACTAPAGGVGLRKDGTEFPVEQSMTMYRTPAGVFFSTVVRDITERKEMEEQLRQAQKMEAVGTLAGGIAHDFNNILGATMGFAELIYDDAPAGSSLKNDARQILQSCTRARDLVRQILAFSRKGMHKKKPVPLVPLVQEAVALLRATLPASIELRSAVSFGGSVWGDATRLHQVLVNLCTNAAHAITDATGSIDITVDSVDIPERVFIHCHFVEAGRYARITVQDTGTGIEAGLIEKIFEPYFTTKEKERGTGLGLAIVHGIVLEHGGAIQVESERGGGSVFSVLLPCLEDEGIETAGPVNRDGEQPRGSERLLFVDDEQAIAVMVERTLQSFGYSVTVATDSREALDRFAADPQAFDLVITDQAMPGMTGYLLAQSILEIRPGMPIILCTGYSDVVTEEKARDAGISAFLMKPVERDRLACTVREVLDGSRQEK